MEQVALRDSIDDIPSGSGYEMEAVIKIFSKFGKKIERLKLKKALEKECKRNVDWVLEAMEAVGIVQEKEGIVEWKGPCGFD